MKHKTHVFAPMRKVIFLFVVTTLFFLSCSKKEKVMYGALGLIDGVEILDIEPFHDSLLLIAGKNKEQQGYLYVYNLGTKKYTATQTLFPMYDIHIDNNTLWACGDSMAMLTSIDNGLSWKEYNSFSYFWTPDKSNFRKIYVRNNHPIYAIGSKDMLNGNVYIKNNNQLYPLKSIQMRAGVNDMVIVDSTQVYVAAYGSIIRFKQDGLWKRYEQVGGHDFTAIAFSGSKTLVSTTYDGKIFTCETTDSIWKKVVDTKFELRHVAADSYGNVLAIGKSNTIYISNDFGNNWRIERYAFGRDVTCLQYKNDTYYIGCKSGEIHTITRKQLE